MKPTVAIADAVAVSSTTTYRSAVMRAPHGLPVEYGVTVEFTSTAAGTLSLEVNNKTHQDYQNDVTSAGSEAANTAGWVQRDLSPTATIAITAAATCTITFKSRFVRWRLKYVNASGSGNWTARVGMP